MNLLAIDYGKKRTGIAACDKDELICYPVCSIFEEEETLLIEKIGKIVLENKTNMLVVGVAVNMDGSFGGKALKCIEFAKTLKYTLNIPVALWDERQTTLLASKYLITSNTKKRKKKNIIDKVAATIILESFIAYKNNNNQIDLV